MNTATGALSGTTASIKLLMATIKRPDIILLDEHTAALDPHATSLNLLHATNERITKDHLAALMITHNLEDALEYGNRLIDA